MLDIITEAAEDKAYKKAAAELLQTGKHTTPEESSPLYEYTSSLDALSIIEQEGGKLLIMRDRSRGIKAGQEQNNNRATPRGHSGISKT